jgi:hypothetical protein
MPRCGRNNTPMIPSCSSLDMMTSILPVRGGHVFCACREEWMGQDNPICAPNSAFISNSSN